MKRSIYTIQTLLEELKKTTPSFKEGQFFETLKSIYPKEEALKEKKTIEYEGKKFTKPLACSRKDKNNYLKEKSPITNFFKNNTKGDFLKVIKVNGSIAECINLSLNENIRDEFYKDDKIIITFNMIANGIIKQAKRKIDKYLNGGK